MTSSFSHFKGAKSSIPDQEYEIEEIKRLIQRPDDELRQKIELLKIEPEENVQNTMKRLLPCVTFSGLFKKRSDDGLVKHSGLYVYDMDKLGIAGARAVKKIVKKIPSVVMSFISPRGNGLKIVMRGTAASDAESHKKFWSCGAKIIEEATRERIDVSGSDVTRLCFLTYDKNVTWNDDVVPFATDVEDVEIDDLDALREVKPKADYNEYGSMRVKEMLWSIGSDLPYEDWRNIIWAVTSRLGYDEAVREMLLEWSLRYGGDRKITDEKLFNKIFDNKKSGITLGTLLSIAKKAGWTDWRKLLRKTEDGDMIHDEGNLRVILNNHPDFKGRWWIDVLGNRQMMDPKDEKDLMRCKLSKAGGILEADVAFQVLCDIQLGMGYNFHGTMSVMTAASSLCSENKRNVRKEWLESLKWDGTKRLKRLFIDGFGADEEEHNEALAVSFLASAAARTLKPGVGVHVAPILIGPQGCGKSSGVRALVPDSEWVCDSFIDMETKAGYEVISRATIVELCELSSIKKAELERVKQFMTQTVVRFRLPYAKQAQDTASSWVFIGTTNEPEFLKDTTGNRRFAPVVIKQADPRKVVEWIKARRDQLWAEAVYIAREGLDLGHDSWGVPRRYWAKLAIVAEQARERDPWEDLVHDMNGRLFEKKPKMKLPDVAMEAGVVLRSHMDEMRFVRVIKKLGWTNQVVKASGKSLRRWVLE